MIDKAAVREFARETLGCGCPDEVFDAIEQDTAVTLDTETDTETAGGLRLKHRFLIGGRLLLYLYHIEPDIDNGARMEGFTSTLRALIEHGRAVRDQNGYNRFRLVLITTAQPDADSDADGGHTERLHTLAHRVYDTLPPSVVDEKVHLHTIERDPFAAKR